jgi:hypothetical protein
MAKQEASAPLPPLPDVPRNAEGHPDGNPSRSDAPQAMADGYPVSPAVARARHGSAAAQGRARSGGDQ